VEFVQHGRTGLIAKPKPEALAAAMDQLWRNPAQAARWGAAGRDFYDGLNISWRTVLQKLLT